MRAVLPNLELLEYQARLAIKNNNILSTKRRLYFEKHGHEYYGTNIELDCQVFSQVWGSTCTAFDSTKNGEPAIGGSAMTKAYTTVFHEPVLDVYIVFVDNKICYIVDTPTEYFLEDLKTQNLRAVSEASEFY
jgi:hypothetical protein